MTKPKNETPEHRAERLRKDRERRAAKRKAERKEPNMEKDLQAPIDPAPESAMQTPSNEKQQGQLLSDAAFSYYLGRQSRRN